MPQSYLSKLPPRDLKKNRDARKCDVKDSLMKFLDDCGNDDLIMAAAHSPRKVTSLSVSEHGPPKRHEETTNSSGPKRRATKNDRHNLTSTRVNDDKRGAAALGISEHGTPSTQKSPLRSLHSSTLHTTRERSKSEIDHNSSDESLMTGDLKIVPLDHAERRSRLASSHSARHISSGNDSRRRSQSKSSRLERSKSDREKPCSRSDKKRVQTRRTKSEVVGAGGVSLGHHLGGERRRQRNRMGVEDDNQSVGSTRSNFSTMSSMTGKSLGLDAGPFNAFFKPERRQSMNASSSASVGPGISLGGQIDDEYLRLRKEKQDKILNEAQKDRWNANNKVDVHEHDDVDSHVLDGFQDKEDDDQPMVKSKKSALDRFKQGISKTRKVTKSTAKGTVNVVRDPKRAARKVGDFAKDVGKETGKMLLDPKLAAKTAVSIGKDMTKGTLDVGKGVAKGGLGLTKSVAMTGVNATSMVVGTALDGAGKVVNGATGLIFKNGNGEVEDQYADYNASELSSRRKLGNSLMERVSNPLGTAPKPKPEVPTRLARNSHSVLPGLMVGNNKNNSYDF